MLVTAVIDDFSNDGHEEGGQLTEAVRRQPYSVILFDEVEKAHPTVLNTFLQILDDGRLTDGAGCTIDFTNTIIIMTSNLGAEYLLKGSMGSCTMEGARELVMQEVRKDFKPEFLNRLDKIVVFDPLSHEQLIKVAELQVKDVKFRLARMGITLRVTEQALMSGRGRGRGRRGKPRWHEVPLPNEILVQEEGVGQANVAESVG
ncbi:chaperone protein ClpB1-like [Camellia sinensis]|uniref:chaperone protein ClpB1-like n=1 Tax=Camellia sinensis TaxID=4442 RepID=UPI001035C78C|nr:chaperone protein ClpB1-like [Camellia sinensis]